MRETPQVQVVVDLDGTLTPTDTFLECVLGLVRRSPIRAVLAFAQFFRGRAWIKSRCAQHFCLAVESLPYNAELIEYLRSQRRQGRRIVLATAADRSIADRVSAHLQLFDRVIASDAGRNLKGQKKLLAILEESSGPFVYAGDSRADIPIWKSSEAAILVGASPPTAAHVRKLVPIECEFPRKRLALTEWTRGLRLYQWLKNLLIFVPVLTAFSFFRIEDVGSVVLAFFSFCFAASGTYILNDLLDLENDRSHSRKRHRPFASGQLHIGTGLVVSVCMLLVGVALAITVSLAVAAVLGLYLLLTASYSLVLKGLVLVDVLSLAVLYTLRIIAGSVAIGVSISPWLLAFSIFIFLSLALVKRCTELVEAQKAGSSARSGRDYHPKDLAVLWPLGVSAAVTSILVLGLFISAPDTQQRYLSPQLLWIVSLCLFYWLGRVWVKTGRGEMHDDPIVFAIKDRGSRVSIFVMIIFVLIAHSVRLDLPL